MDRLMVPEMRLPEVVQAGDALWLLTLTESRLKSYLVAADGSTSSGVEVPLPQAREHFQVVASQRSAYAPEFGRLGMCVVLPSGVWFLSLDARGELVDGPLAIEESYQGAEGFDTRTARVCDIAWSGEEFLVVWLNVDNEIFSNVVPISMYPPVLYSLRARIVKASSLAQANGQ